MASLGRIEIVRVLSAVALSMLALTGRAALAGPVQQDNSAVEMTNFTFAPKTLTVPVGATVTWTNQDQVTHTSTQDSGVWDSGNVAPGASFSFTFDEAGSFPYYCKPHGGPGGAGMSGVIVVTAAEAASTTTGSQATPEMLPSTGSDDRTFALFVALALLTLLAGLAVAGRARSRGVS